MAKLKNPRGDGRDCDVLDSRCAARRCLNVAEDKGAFVQGRGYVSYHRHPQLVCWTRHLRGCPDPIPDPDPELYRCCEAPKFSTRGRASKRRCKSCGRWASGDALAALRSLGPVSP